MKKIIFAAVLFLFTIVCAYAQKIDLDKRRFKIEYLELPGNATLSYFDYYSADVFAERSTIEKLKLTSIISSYLQLEGYIYSEEKAEFSYTISIDKPVVVYETIDPSTSSYKSSDGTYKYITQYTAIIQAAIPTTIYLKLVPYGTVIYTSTFSTVNNPTLFKSTPQDTKEKAQYYLNDSWRGLNTSIREVYLKKLLAEVTHVKETFTFRKVTSSSFLLNIDDKNSPQFTQFNNEVLKAVIALEKLSYKSPIDSVRISLLPTLTYFLNTAQSIQPSDKQLKKFRYASLYNLAICQYHLEILNDCKKTAQEIIDNDYNKNDGKTINEDVEWLLKSFKASERRSRHLYRPGFDSTELYQYILPPK